MNAICRRALLTWLASAAVASAASAVTTQITIQGYAYNSAGTPYTTPQTAEFKVYQGGNATTAGSGTLYYDETATISPSASGVFDYALGSGSPTVAFLVVGGTAVQNVLSTTTFDTTSAVYLEISVAGNIVLPRIQFRGVPYASLSTVAEHLKPTDTLSATTLTVSSGTFTATGPNQYSIATASGIIVNAGGVTAPYFLGTLIGNISGVAGNVAAGSVTPGTLAAGVLVPPTNIIGGIASTNTANTFPLSQSFPGGLTASSGTFSNGITASSGTFTASGPNQPSVTTSSGIIAGGPVTSPAFIGTLYGNVSGGAGSVAATNVTPGTLAAGVLVPSANVIGGIASTNTANTFPLTQSFPGGLTGSSGSFSNSISASSGTFTASGPNQYSIATTSGINSGGPVTAPAFIGTLYGNVSGGAGSVAAGNVTPGTIAAGVLVPAVNITPGTLAAGVLVPPSNIVGGIASTNTVNIFPLAQSFPGGMTASSGTFTASGPNQASITASSGIVAGGPVTSPAFIGTLYGNVSGGAGSVAAANITPGTLAGGVLVPTANIVGGIASTNTANTFPFAQSFLGGLAASSGNFSNGITASSGTFTASGPNQYSIATTSGINSGGPVTAPAFVGTLYGNVNGNAANVAAANVTPGTLAAGVLVPPANIVGGVASTNTANTFPLSQSFPGGMTASSGTFTASGPNQASITTSSGILVNAGGVTAAYFLGTLIGNVNGVAGSVAAGSVTPGTFAAGVLVPPANIIGGVASTNTANTFPLSQSFPGGMTASNGTFTASGPNQASITTSSGIVAGGPVAAPAFVGTLYGNVNGTAGNVAAADVTPGTLAAGVLVPPANILGGIASTNTTNTFPLAQSFPGGLVGSSGSFSNGITASSGTFTASGPNQYSIATTSGINSGGPIAAPAFIGTLYGHVNGTAANVAAADVTPGTLAGGVLVLPANIVGGVASTNTANTFPLTQSFPGGLTASSGTFTASGPNQASITTSSGIAAGGPVAAPAFVGTLYGTLIGNAQGAPPIGALLPYAGSIEPSGWIECDGRSVPQSGFASASWGSYNVSALFAAIGTVWGSAGAGVFNIPDLRGTFPRGWNHGKTGSFSDPDASSRINQYTSGTTGDTVGSYQADQLKSHTHSYYYPGPADAGGGGGGPNVPAAGTTGATGGNETRPRNASVMYIIRVQ